MGKYWVHLRCLGKVSLIVQNLVQYKSIQVYFDKYESILPDEMLQEELKLKNSRIDL